ncbi:MAG: hypothetical protein P1P90_06335 [Patescibacteria group bacterium]|nr:hypothetical protein [Patescibacteria group bacterium]
MDTLKELRALCECKNLPQANISIVEKAIRQYQSLKGRDFTASNLDKTADDFSNLAYEIEKLEWPVPLETKITDIISSLRQISFSLKAAMGAKLALRLK